MRYIALLPATSCALSLPFDPSLSSDRFFPCQISYDVFMYTYTCMWCVYIQWKVIWSQTNVCLTEYNGPISYDFFHEFDTRTHTHTNHSHRQSTHEHTDMCTCTLSYTQTQMARSEPNTSTHWARLRSSHTEECVRVYKHTHEAKRNVTFNHHTIRPLFSRYMHLCRTHHPNKSPEWFRCNQQRTRFFCCTNASIFSFDYYQNNPILWIIHLDGWKFQNYVLHSVDALELPVSDFIDDFRVVNKTNKQISSYK